MPESLCLRHVGGRSGAPGQPFPGMSSHLQLPSDSVGRPGGYTHLGC